MKRMMALDFFTMRGMAGSLLLVSAFVFFALVFGMRDLCAPLAAVAAMVPLLALTSLGALDDAAGWGGFRLALPLGRRQVVTGRYAFLLLLAVLSGLLLLCIGFAVWALFALFPGDFAAELHASAGLVPLTACLFASLSCSMFACAVALPLFMRFGSSKGVRYVPLFAACAAAFIMAASASAGGPLGSLGLGARLILWLDASDLHLLAAAFVAFAGSLILYAASAFLAVRLYEAREF